MGNLLRLLLLAALLLLLPVCAFAVINCPSGGLVASRSTGTAPLFVFFDASGTNGQYTSTTWSQDTLLNATANQSFRDLTYQWDFNDPGAGTWGDQGVGYVDGLPRNKATGPVVAHLFETAGTYQPTLAITNTSGQSCSVTLSTITVTAANTTWTGTATECVAASSTPVAGSGGCPSGAAVLQQAVFETALTTAVNAGARRVLFNGGDIFTGTNGYDVRVAGPGYIGSYGTGQATVSIGGSNSAYMVGFRTLGSDWRVVGITWTGTNNGSDGNSNAVMGSSNQVTSNPSQLLMLRNKILAGFEYGMNMNDFFTTGDGSFDQVGMMENNFAGPTQGSSGNCSYAFFGGLHHGAIIGNDLSTAAQTGTCTGHVVRVVCAKTMWGAHNRTNSDSSNSFQVQSQDDAGGQQCAGSQSPSGGSFFFDISDNVIKNTASVIGGNNPLSLGVANNCDGGCPPASIEYTHDYIAERNLIVQSSNVTSSELTVAIGGQRAVYRNNILNMVFQDGGGPIFQLSGLAGNVPITNIEIYNNTIFWKNFSGSNPFPNNLVASQGSSTISGIISRNNLTYDLTSKTINVTNCPGSGCLQDHNLAVATGGVNPFVSVSPSVAADFQLALGSAAAGFGAVVGEPPQVPVAYDFGLNARPVSPSKPSAGAWDNLSTSPAISVIPSALTASATVGSSPAVQTFQVVNSGNGTLTGSVATSDATHCPISPTTFSGLTAGAAQIITVTYSTAALPAGSIGCTFTASATGLASQQATATITLLTPPALSVSPTTLSVTAPQGQNPGTSTIHITNTGQATLTNNITCNSLNPTFYGNNLGVNPIITIAQPISGGAATPVVLNYTVTTLTSAGSPYSDTITCGATGVSNVTVSVTITITSVGTAPTYTLNSIGVGRTLVQGQVTSNLTVQVVITSTGSSQVNVSVSSNQPWLSFTADSHGACSAGACTTTLVGGTLFDRLTGTIDTTGLTPGTYIATVTAVDAGSCLDTSGAASSCATLTASFKLVVQQPPTVLFQAGFLNAFGPIIQNSTAVSLFTFPVCNSGFGSMNVTLTSNDVLTSLTPSTVGPLTNTQCTNVTLSSVGAWSYNKLPAQYVIIVTASDNSSTPVALSSPGSLAFAGFLTGTPVVWLR